MTKKLTYEELEQRVKELEKEAVQLRKSQDFTTFFENSPVLIARFDRDLCHVYVNPAILRVTELSFDDYVGKSNHDLGMPEDLTKLWDSSIKSVFETGQKKEIEFNYQTLSGEQSYQSLLVPEYSGDGRIETVLGFIRDITKQKQAEKALQKSEEKYHNLYDLLRLMCDNVPDLIWSKDLEGRFRFVNKAMCDKLIMCDSPEKALGKTDMFFAEQIRNAGYEHTFGEKCVDSDAIVKEKRAPDRFLEDGLVSNKYLVLDVHKAPFLNKDGEMIGTVGCGRDVTKEKEAEEALRESQQIIEGIINAIPVRVFWKDKNLVYLGCNAIFAHDAGFADPKDIIGKDDYQMVWCDQAELYRGDDRQIIKSGVPKLLIEEPQTTPEGNTIRLLTSKIPLHSSTGEIIGVIGTYMDITERKQVEEALRISRENLLEESNQRKILSKRLIELLEKDRHDIAMELHDNIGQILTSLKIYLEIIDDKLKPTDTELGSLTKDAIKRANQAINDLNNIAQGLMPGILDALGLVPSLRSLLNEFREFTDIKIDFFNRNVQKRFDREKELAIYRIVQEALNNIVKHAKAKNVYVSLLKKGNVLSLSVEDNGVGFDQDKAMKMSKGKGPLGLVIMEERAMQLDGEFTLESTMGKGTHLLVEIPI